MSSPTSPPIWLDVLPEEVCILLAARLTRGLQNQPSLQYAQLGGKHRRAAIFSLGKTYEECEGAENISAWRKAVLNVDIDAIYLTQLQKPISTHLYFLLEEPTLRDVTIPDHPALLSAISGSTFITELTLILSHNIRHRTLGTLQMLRLRKLSLHCKAGREERCYLGLGHALGPAEIATHCPDLACLELRCRCVTTPNDLNWIYVSRMPSLSETTIRVPPPDDLLQRLSSFDSVKFQIPWLENAALLARQMSNAVTYLDLSGSALSAEQVEAFDFPKLRTLNCRIWGGAEVAFVEVCRRSFMLQDLRLEWEHDSRESRDRFDDYETAVEGCVLRIAQAAPKLANLALCHVRVSMEEVKAVLKGMGSRLHLFEASLQYQEEDQFDRMLTILETLVVHNRLLLELHFRDIDMPAGALTSTRLVQAIALFCRLRRRNPYLDLVGLPFQLRKEIEEKCT